MLSRYLSSKKFVATLYRSTSARLIGDMEPFTCPICRQPRPEEYHLEWCTYEGPDWSDTDPEED